MMTFLAPALRWASAVSLVEEETGGFDDDVGADFVPLQVGRILFGGQADLLAVDDEGVALDSDVTLEAGRAPSRT